MDSNNWLYFKINQYLLQCFGLWPYQSKFTKHCNFLFFVIWTSLITLPLVQGVIYTTDSVVFYGTILGINFILGTLLVGTNLYARSHWLARLFSKIESDLSSITDAKELAIMEKFGRQAQASAFKHMGGAIISAIVFMAMNYLPFVYANDEEYSKLFSSYAKDWIITENLSRVQIIIHLSLEIFYAAFMYTATTAVYICGVKHTCGMYAIVSYRLHKLMRNRKMIKHKKTTSHKNDVKLELLDIISLHREAIKCTHIVRRTFSRTFYTVQIGALICMAIVLFLLKLGVTINSTLLTFKGVACSIICIGHIFYLNYEGQQIIEHSSKVFYATYHMEWYLMSVDERKILLMIIMRSAKFDRLSAGTMSLSLQDFTDMMAFSWSLAAVLASMLERTGVPLE